MPKTRQNWIIFIVVTALVGGVWIGVTRVDPDAINPTGRPPSADIGHPAPDFTLVNLEGDEVALSDFKGQPIILNFWATWCGPCRAEMPSLQAASVSLDGQAVILGVNVREQPSAVGPFLDQYGVTYPVVLDEGGRIQTLYRIRAFPTTYFIDEQGVITEIISGALNEPMLRIRVANLMEN